jgi:hypothetical protein
MEIDLSLLNLKLKERYRSKVVSKYVMLENSSSAGRAFLVSIMKFKSRTLPRRL